MDATFDYFTGQRRPEQDGILAGYAAAGIRAVEDLRPDRDVAYGPHPRQVFDYFHGQGAKRGLMAYFHAGYWQGRDKSQFHFLAEPFVARGVDVAMVNHPLCPDVTLTEVTQSAQKSIPAILAHAEGSQNLVVAGHSAGAHLAVELALTDWGSKQPIAAIVPISGVYDLEPLLDTPINNKLRLDRDSARANSPIHRVPDDKQSPPALFLVGGRETAAFHGQTRRMHEAWLGTGNRSERRIIADECHFSILRSCTTPANPAFEAILALIVG